MCFGLAAYWLLFAGLKLGDGGPSVLGIAGIVGLIWAACTARRREHAAFVSDAGVPVFSIRRPSQANATYDAFLETLINQIRLAKNMAQGRHTTVLGGDHDAASQDKQPATT
jgi:hypothetical protein